MCIRDRTVTASNSGLSNVVEDTTPQLGGNLDLDGKFITGSGGASITGVVTATTFSGSGASLTNLPSGQLSGALPALDGSALTGVTASGSGIVVKHDGTTVGTAGTVNFSTNLDVTAVSAGIVTITASGGTSLTSDAQLNTLAGTNACLLYTSPSPRDRG